MKPGLPIWSDQEFAYPEGEKELRFPLVVNRSGERSLVDVKLKPIPGAKTCQIGAVMDTHLDVRIMVRTDEMIVQSEKMALLPADGRE